MLLRGRFRERGMVVTGFDGKSFATKCTSASSAATPEVMDEALPGDVAPRERLLLHVVSLFVDKPVEDYQRSHWPRNTSRSRYEVQSGFKQFHRGIEQLRARGPRGAPLRHPR